MERYPRCGRTKPHELAEMDVIDDVCDDLEIGFRMIFQAIPSYY